MMCAVCVLCAVCSCDVPSWIAHSRSKNRDKLSPKLNSAICANNGILANNVIYNIICEDSVICANTCYFVSKKSLFARIPLFAHCANNGILANNE